MKITDAFLGEHAVFYAQFNACERTLDDMDAACLRRQAALIASALEPHARLENALLFDELQARAGDGAIFEVMEQEHREIERMLAQIQQARDVDMARALLIDVIHAAREHFAKEERIAFPLVERMLGAAELVRLGERWAEARGVTVGGSLPDG